MFWTNLVLVEMLCEIRNQDLAHRWWKRAISAVKIGENCLHNWTVNVQQWEEIRKGKKKIMLLF